VILATLAAGVGVYGGLDWRSGVASRSSSCTLAGQLGKQFVPDVYAQCQDAKRDVSLGIVLLIAGFVVFAVLYAPARTSWRRFRDRIAAMSPPAGWMRFPRNWKPSNALFMPVPPGWPQPPADWVPDVDWLPHPTWPALPRGWPQPQQVPRREVVRLIAAALGVSVIGVAALGLELAWPVTAAGWSATGLFIVEVAALLSARNLVGFYRRRGFQMPLWTAFAVVVASYNYATSGPSRWVSDTANVFAVIAAVAVISLCRHRYLWATRFPKDDANLNVSRASGQPSAAIGA
jgi:hypothetical protein